jgi:hypothetical protein
MSGEDPSVMTEISRGFLEPFKILGYCFYKDYGRFVSHSTQITVYSS